MGNIYNPVDLFIQTCNYDIWFQSEELSNTTRKSDKENSADLSNMPPLEGDEEVKQGKGLKMLSLNKLLTRLPILLPQLKAENNSCTLKNETRQILYFLCQHSKITKKVCKNLIKSL